MMPCQDQYTTEKKTAPLGHMRLQGEEGVVIISVLWICALIMWFALQIGAETRLQGEEELHHLRWSQAFYLATGGCYEALARMGSAPPSGFEETQEQDWQPNGVPHVVDYRSGQAMVMIESENRKVNVNLAGHEQLKAALEKAGLNEGDADVLADRIRDFIDQDDIPGLKGAEKDRYAAEGLSYGPFNGPLTSLDQLLLVPGITQQIFYGYGSRDDTLQEEYESGIYIPPALPRPHSLFQVLTVYGKNTFLQDNEEDQEAIRENITWENGGIYRILSAGITSSGPPAVIIWLTVRSAPEKEEGYEVLYRKIL